MASRYHRAESRARETIARAAAESSKDSTIRRRATPIERQERKQAETAAAEEKEKKLAYKDPEKAEEKKQKRIEKEQAEEEARRMKKKPGRPTREEYEFYHGKKEESATGDDVKEKKNTKTAGKLSGVKNKKPEDKKK